jgi:hypothetical protein
METSIGAALGEGSDAQIADSLLSLSICGTVFPVTRCIMIDHQKFQRARGWAYAVGAVIFGVVVAWRFLIR